MVVDPKVPVGSIPPGQCFTTEGGGFSWLVLGEAAGADGPPPAGTVRCARLHDGRVQCVPVTELVDKVSLKAVPA